MLGTDRFDWLTQCATAVTLIKTPPRVRIVSESSVGSAAAAWVRQGQERKDRRRGRGGRGREGEGQENETK